MTFSLPDDEEPALGHHFVANETPFSVWKSPCQEVVEAALERLGQGPLGLYAHIPFCRKRCHFCYSRVYTGQDSATVSAYTSALIRELSLYVERPALPGRQVDFVYFGGGAPSEIAFECEPGTATSAKLKMLRQLGVSRLSMGFESMQDAVLEAAGRAHRRADEVI